MRELLEKRRVNAAASEKVGSVVYVSNLVVAAATGLVGIHATINALHAGVQQQGCQTAAPCPPASHGHMQL